MKRFVLAAVALYITVMSLSLAIHAGILGGDYLQLPHLFRPESEQASFMPFMMLADLPYVLGAVWIYRAGIQRKPWLGQGVRFGIALWAVTWCYVYLVYYALQPWPGMLVVKQIALSLASAIIQGIVLAAIYRQEAAAAPHAGAAGA